MRNAGLDEAQAGTKTARSYINNLTYTDDTTLMAESEELKSLLMKTKEESKKFSLKLNSQKTKITASGPITSWQIDGERVRDFIFLGSKITADLHNWCNLRWLVQFAVTAAMKLNDASYLEEKLWPTSTAY